MMDLSIDAAPTHEEGVGTVVSFGSGDTGGRTQRAAAGRGGNRNASARQVSAVRSQINRAGTTGRSRRAQANRALLQELQDAANRRGNTNLRRLAGIQRRLREINS